MTQYVGCDHAQELLEGFADGELPMADQLAVESHLRWCRTCAMRLDDLRLIGASLRQQSASTQDPDTDRAVAAVHEAVLMRISAEQDQSWGVRIRDTFSDMRLLWPAIGATAAVALCVTVAGSVLQATSVQQDESLAALISTLSNPALLKPTEDDFFGVAMPRPNEDDAERTGGTLDSFPEDDLIYTVRTVVDADGRVSNYEVLLAGEGGTQRPVHDRAVLDAVAQTRFVAAQGSTRRSASFDMVWVIAKTTAVAGPAIELAPMLAAPVIKSVPKPEVQAPASPDNPRSSTNRPLALVRRSATA
jgi:hypothetical protein